MMKLLSSILLPFVFMLGLALATHEGTPDSRQSADTPAESLAGYVEANCSFTIPAHCTWSDTRRTVYSDYSANHLITDALRPTASLTQGIFFKQLFRLKAYFIAPLQNNFLLWSSEQTPISPFTPSAIRYSCGYFIYALAHILI